MVVLGQKRLYSAKWLYSGRNGCIRAKWFGSGNVVLFGQGGCFEKVALLGQSVNYRAKVVVLVQSGCIQVKMLVFGQSGCNRKKWL